MFDMIVPYLSLGQAIGRWGNFINGEAHGTTTSSIFRMGIIEKWYIYGSTSNVFYMNPYVL